MKDRHPDARDLQPGEPEPEALGDCFEVAFRYLMEARNPEARLVHAVCLIGTGPRIDLPYGHAWVEVPLELAGLEDIIAEKFGAEREVLLESLPRVCIDLSNGRDIRVPHPFYYLGGRPTQIHRYTFLEAANLAIDTGIYGPWELECER